MIEGVSEHIAAAMKAVGANVLTENNLMLHTCEHGIRHPVGHVDSHIGLRGLGDRHEKVGPFGGRVSALCCGPACCPAYDEINAPVVTQGAQS